MLVGGHLLGVSRTREYNPYIIAYNPYNNPSIIPTVQNSHMIPIKSQDNSFKIPRLSL